MKALAQLFGIALVSAAAGCDIRSGPPPLSPSRPQPLQLIVEATPLTNGARIAGQTNLPDGTRLMLGLHRGPVFAGPEVQVRDGRFVAEIFPSRNGRTPPGDYEIRVSTPLGDLQPDEVRGQLGRDYEALSGPLVRPGTAGRIIEYTGRVRIGGQASARADRDARRAAYRESVEFAERSCRQLPDQAERLTGERMSAERRARNIRDCLRDMQQDRQDAEREGLIER